MYLVQISENYTVEHDLKRLLKSVVSAFATQTRSLITNKHENKKIIIIIKKLKKIKNKHENVWIQLGLMYGLLG